MSEWYTCPKCGATRENQCACPNPDCPDSNYDRADGRTLCLACGLSYSNHDRDNYYPWLVVLCNGKKVKL